MELITLCGVVIVVFCAWIELEPVVRRVVNAVSRARLRNTVNPAVSRAQIRPGLGQRLLDIPIMRQ